MNSIRRIFAALALCAAAPLSACSAKAPTGDVAPDGGTFEPMPPRVYVAKVKNALVGLAPTDEELRAVDADASALGALVDGWMKLPEYRQKMLRFFELAFQQTQITPNDFLGQVYAQIGMNEATTPRLMQNLEQSFARTMLELVSEEHPLTEATTTRKFMLTTALKELYAFLDMWQVDDAGKVTDRFRVANPMLTITVGAAQGPIPIAETLDPASPNYMHWYDPDVATANSQVPGCAQDPIPYPSSGLTLHWLLYGSLENHKVGTVTCQQFGGTATAPQFAATDFSDWQMVTVREPAAGELTTKFYDLPALRTATELVLSIPRVGFFSTPAFFANWQTNISNQQRVTMNQTLIVALGSQVDGTDDTPTGANPPGLDAVHASAQACFYCHRTLDPLRSMFSSNYSWNYHNQTEASFASQKGIFTFRGVSKPVNSVGDMGQALADHPLFAEAWAQKLCYYANSSACVSTDPEFQRIVTAFRSANYSWNTLVLELFSSPITTNAAETATADANGEVVAVSRRDHMCAALDNRLGFDDACGLDIVKKKVTGVIPQIVSGLPSDGYGRGSTVPVLPNQPTLFYRAGIENICAGIAALVIDVPAAKQVAGVKQWSSTQPDAAIADFVAMLMALTSSDPRASQATTLLKAHFTDAKAQGATAGDALKSTFITACMAPSAVSIGL